MGSDSKRPGGIQCPAPPLPKSAYTEKGKKKAAAPVPPDLRETVSKTAAPRAGDLEQGSFTGRAVGSADPGGLTWEMLGAETAPSPPPWEGTVADLEPRQSVLRIASSPSPCTTITMETGGNPSGEGVGC